MKAFCPNKLILYSFCILILGFWGLLLLPKSALAEVFFRPLPTPTPRPSGSPSQAVVAGTANESYGWQWVDSFASSFNQPRIILRDPHTQAAIQADWAYILLYNNDTGQTQVYSCSSNCPADGIYQFTVPNGGWCISSSFSKVNYHSFISTVGICTLYASDGGSTVDQYFMTWNSDPPTVRVNSPAPGVWYNYTPIHTVTINPAFDRPVSNLFLQNVDGSSAFYISPLFYPPWPTTWSHYPGTLSEGYWYYNPFAIMQSANEPNCNNCGITHYPVNGGGSGFGIDTSPPAVACSLSRSENQITVNLNASDRLSGIGAGGVLLSQNGGGWTASGLPNGGNYWTSFVYNGSPGNTYQFIFRARDKSYDSFNVQNQWSAYVDCGTVTIPVNPTPTPQAPTATPTPVNPPPTLKGVTISTSPVVADNLTQYIITISTQDGSGVADIDDQYVLINYGDTTYRGDISWSNRKAATNGYFERWGGTGALKTGSLKTCTNQNSGVAEGRGGIYIDQATYGANYVNLVSCTTVDSGDNIRTTRFTVTFDPLFRTNGPLTNNRVWGWSYDVSGQYDPLGWYPGSSFDIAVPNLYATPGSIVLRYGFGAVANCSNGIVVANGAGVPNGTVMEVCVTYGNNGTGSTGASYLLDNYVNQATQPAAGTAGYQSYPFGPTAVGGPFPNQQVGSIVADSTKCSSNCHAGVFFDRNNTIAESNETDNFATSVAYNVVAAKTLRGNVWIDSGFDSCQASTRTPYPNTSTASVKVDSGSSTLGSGAVTNNAYAVGVVPGSGYSATLYNLPADKNYTVRFVSTNSGTTWTPLSGFTYSPIDLSTADKTLDWCLNDTRPWSKYDDGDKRFPSFNNPEPSGTNPSISNNPLAAFFSSNFTSSIGAGSTSSFVINNEYSFNDDPRTKQGLFSYTFFRNRAKIKGVATDVVPGCPASGNCTISSSTAFPPTTQNKPYLVNGDLTINGYTHPTGTHVLLLVNGNVTINSNIKIPAGYGNLFVLAAGSDTKDPTKGNITVASSVGSAPTNPDTACPIHNPVQLNDYSCSNIEGIYSAEKSFILATKASCPTTADNQLTMAGNIITNALKPFATNGSGKFDNRRTLCTSGDKLYPVFVMQSRYDFVPQLTDFYKVPSVRWKEVNP